MKILKKALEALINAVKTGACARMDVTREYYQRDIKTPED